MYGDAKGICDKMWGDAFYYVDDAEGSDDFCMTMLFDSDMANPNNPAHDKWHNSGCCDMHNIDGLNLSILLLCFILIV